MLLPERLLPVVPIMGDEHEICRTCKHYEKASDLFTKVVQTEQEVSEFSRELKNHTDEEVEHHANTNDRLDQGSKQMDALSHAVELTALELKWLGRIGKWLIFTIAGGGMLYMIIFGVFLYQRIEHNKEGYTTEINEVKTSVHNTEKSLVRIEGVLGINEAAK